MHAFMRRNFGLAYVILVSLGAFALSCVHSIGVPYLEHFGLSKIECSRMNEICHLAMLLACIPAGVFADMYGRKTICLAANIILALGALVYGLSSTMLGFGLAEATLGLGFALGGCAFQAWVVDKHMMEKSDYSHTIMMTFIVGGASRIFGSFFGAQMASLHISLPWFAITFFMTVATILTFFWMEEVRSDKRLIARSLRKTLGHAGSVLVQGFSHALSHSATRFIFLMCGLQLLAFKGSDMQWAPYFQSFGLSQGYLGVVGALICTATATGSLAAKYIGKRSTLSEKARLSTLSFFIGSSLVLAGLGAGRLLVAGLSFFLHQVFRGWWSTTASIALNAHIPSNTRATILSAYTMFSVMTSMMGLEFGGQIAERCSIPSAWIVGGLTLVVGSFFLYRRR